MRIGAVVQARMTSRRCPGKVLRPLGGTTVLGQLLENLAQSRRLDSSDSSRDSSSRNAPMPHFHAICVATSDDPSDDAIEQYCRDHRWRCVRGPLNDVARRFQIAIADQDLDGFVRISGDSPLLDYRVLDMAISMFQGADVDLVTNVYPRTFPRGQSVEVIRCDTFLDTLNDLESEHQREHVTPFLYANAEHFRILNLTYSSDQSSVQLAVDTEEDYEVINSICHSLSKSICHYPWPILARLSDDFRAQAWGVAV